MYTSPRSEKKVTQILNANGFEAYCPFHKVEKEWKGRKKVVEEPLFKCFVFVKMENASQLSGLTVDGIINLVHWRGEPAVVSGEEIAIIKRFLYEFRYVSLEKTEVAVAEPVRVQNSPSLKKGPDTIQVRYETVKVILPSMGYMMVADTETPVVETISILSDKKIPVNGQESSSSTALQEEEVIN